MRRIRESHVQSRPAGSVRPRLVALNAPAPAGTSGQDKAAALTPRQQQIAVLIACGFTNRQIADELVLARGTVANHVEHMLNRLGLNRRSQLAVWAAEHGLLAPPRGPNGMNQSAVI